MRDEKRDDNRSLFDRLTAFLLGLPWPAVLGDLWKIIAHQDQAWGDGEILVDYRCSPGTPVDRYRSGYKTYVLISWREVKNRDRARGAAGHIPSG